MSEFIRYGIIDGIPTIETSLQEDGFIYCVFNQLDDSEVVSKKKYDTELKKFESDNKTRIDAEVASLLEDERKNWDIKHDSLLKDGLSETSIILLIGERP